MKTKVFFATLGIFVIVLQISTLTTARNVKPPPAAPLRSSSSNSAKTTEEPDAAPAVAPGDPAVKPVSECTPVPSADANHFIIGYGSLVHTASKERTVKNTGESIPVEVQGFRREWNLKGDGLGPDTTYLGVVIDPKSSFNGVIFQLRAQQNSSIVNAINQYDAREKFYCRKRVDIKDIKVLGGQKIKATDGPSLGSETENSAPVSEAPAVSPSAVSEQPEPALGANSNSNSNRSKRPRKMKNEFWIYVNKPEFIDPPTKDYPIVESYVDVFLSGCLEVGEKFNLKDFAKNCVMSTKGWNENWLNDRIFPRRPFVHQPLAGKIDAVLDENVHKEFEKIQIEG